MRSIWRAWVVGAVLAGVALRSDAQLLQIFPDPNPAGGDGFGQAVQSVALVNGDVLVGAPLATVGAQSNAGVAYVLDGAGRLVRTLQSPNPAAGGMFGTAVLGAGSDLLVSAPGDAANGTSGAGEVYLFDGTTFALVRTYQPPSPQPALHFGLSLLLDGTTLYAGGSNTLPPSFAGAGALYAVDFATGTFVRSFQAPVPTANALFGQSFTVTGGMLVAGAPGTSVAGNSGAGATYVLDASAGTLLHALQSPNPTTGGAFGSAVALLGSTLLVGAPGDTGAGVSGSGVVYTFDATTGVQQKLFTAPNPSAGLAFGQVIVAGTTTFFVGTQSAPVGSFTTAGQVYELDGSKGTLLQLLQSPNPRTGGDFGSSLVLEGTQLLVGEPAPGAGTPKLYLLDVSNTAPPAPPPPKGGIPTTTTTTLPGNCIVAPTFTSVQCELGALEATVTGAALGRLGQRLLVSLGRAQSRVERAQAASGRRRARAALAAALRNLGTFNQRWQIASGRIDLATQSEFLLLVEATREAVRGLQAAL